MDHQMRSPLCLILCFAVTAVYGQMTREELAARIGANAQSLSDQGVSYNARWTPPGSIQSWNMDCSNAARWFYLDAAGHDLPRTASSQYETLRQQRRLWRVNAKSTSWFKNLKPGDLLFWENTYKPKRKSPITHVMVYLGRAADGSLKMAGSQGSRGVDIYTFRPQVAYGGYNWFLWFKRQGRFVAFGRPL
jgi:cell wall-associated NlpC family hydrolase